MEYEFSVTSNAIKTAAIALSTIYRVNADISYDVSKNEIDSKSIIACRTIKGEGVIKLANSQEFRLVSGTIAFLNLKDIRRYKCAGDFWNFYWFQFVSDSEFTVPVNFVYENIEDFGEESMVSECIRYLRTEDRTARARASAVFSLMLYRWLSSLPEEIKPGRNIEAVRKTIEYIKNFDEKNISVKMLARMASMSERSYRDYFRHATGRSPKTYITEHRLGIAEAMLRHTPLSVSEISERLGYSSQFHFSREFCKKFGVSPSQFRK